jgi:hypothetical protein
MKTAAKKGTRATTITVDVEYSGDAEIGIEEVTQWLENASEKEIKALGFSEPGILINCRADANNLYDLQRIQEICNGLHVSDILAKLAA